MREVSIWEMCLFRGFGLMGGGHCVVFDFIIYFIFLPSQCDMSNVM